MATYVYLGEVLDSKCFRAIITYAPLDDRRCQKAAYVVDIAFLTP